MDWLQCMRNAINYMEANILEDIDYDEIAKCAYSSAYHFQRMFSMLTGFSVGEYIRNRRLTLAAQELSMSDVRVTDIAFKYRYETSEAFTKAFQRFHGVTPSAAREPGAKLKSYGPLSIQIVLKGDREMNFKIVEREGFTVFGATTDITGENAFDAVPKFWLKLGKQDFFKRICSDAGYDLTVPPIAVTHDFQSDGSRKYTIAYKLPEGKKPEGYDVLQIPGATWVVVEEKCEKDEDTSRTIQEMWTRLFSEWFPTSNYEVAEGPQLEQYYPGKLEVCVPVLRKS
ncbi:MAG TPA: helix-turn-helix domain-containing protein [Clostridia bacterium]|nr:helix-turn-helix domain-containing protein [Clostridia bacterium]